MASPGPDPNSQRQSRVSLAVEPFNLRRLKLEYLNHPRSARGPLADWDLARGFRLRVVSSKLLFLYLAPLQAGELTPLSLAPQPGEDGLAVVLGAYPEEIQRAHNLFNEEGWEPGAILILSDDRRLKSLRPLRQQLKEAARAAPLLTVWVFQDLPPEGFFNPEQVLHQLGRISRQIVRRIRWRRRLPF